MDKMARHFDLDLLNTLLVIAETGSLSAAAPQLCRSQSAVSEQVRKLEEMCGLPLLVRGKTGASLTPAGDRLADHARELLARSDAAYRDMQGVQLAGDLRLAITDYFRPRALPSILRRVRDRFRACIFTSRFARARSSKRRRRNQGTSTSGCRWRFWTEAAPETGMRGRTQGCVVSV